MTNQESQELLNRYLRGECSAEEIKQIEAWYETLPQADLPDAQLLGEEIKMNIDSKLQYTHSHIVNLRWIWVAASVFVLFVCGYWWKYHSFKVAESAYTQINVPPGERMNLVLDDGTTVIVNGSSKIAYPQAFTGKLREVTLIEGEAYFDVKHDASRPFIVKSKGTRIIVLGTAFNVRAYNFLKNIQITVIRGKVSVCRPREPVVTLLPDDQVTIATASPHIIKTHIHANDYVGWIQGKYRFDNETLGNVASALESYYKVHISFTDESIKDIRFSSEFESTDKLEDLLFDICKANNLTYVITDQKIILSRKK